MSEGIQVVGLYVRDQDEALAFYQRSGFSVFKRGVEVDDDPRLSGKLRRDSVEHHPIIA